MSFYIDTTGDEANLILAESSHEDEAEDFILVPKASKRSTKRERKEARKQSEKQEQELILNDYLENCDSIEDLMFEKLVNLSDSEQSEQEIGVLEALLENNDDIGFDSASSIDFDDREPTGFDEEDDAEYLRQDFMGERSEWTTSKSALEIEKQTRFLERLNGTPSKSQMKKERKRQQKLKREQRRENQETREQQSEKLNGILKNIQGNKITRELQSYLVKTNKIIYNFAANDTEYCILPNMPGAIRRIVVQMTKYYHVLPKTQGSGKRKATFLYRTGLTSIPTNWQGIPQIVSNETLRGPMGKHKDGPATRKKKRGVPQTKAGQPKVGDVVGATAAPINNQNIGHKMMMQMGWSPGQGLGDGQGLTQPIEVQIRANRAGLGT